jgi:hypothetical protein
MHENCLFLDLDYDSLAVKPEELQKLSGKHARIDGIFKAKRLGSAGHIPGAISPAWFVLEILSKSELWGSETDKTQ